MAERGIGHTFPDNIAWNLLLIYCALGPLVILPVGSVLYGLSDILLPVSVAVLLLEYLVGGMRLRLPVVLLAGYLCLACFSVFNLMTAPTYPAFFRVVRLGGIFMPFFLAASGRFSNRYHLRRMLAAFFVGATASVVLGIVFFFLGIVVKTNMQQYDYSGQLMFRAQGIFGDSGAYGTLCALWLCLVLVGLLTSRWRSKKSLVLLGCLLVGLVTAYVSLSRLEVFGVLASILALPVVLRFSGCRVNTHLMKRLAAMFALMVALGCAGFLLSPPVVQATVVSRVSDTIGGNVNSATGGRVSLWERNFSLLEGHYMTGIGYKGMIQELHEAPDNSYFSALVETGLLGFIFFFGFVLSVTFRLVRNMRRAPNALLPVLVMWFAVLSIAVVVDVFTFWGPVSAVMGIFGVASGIFPRRFPIASIAYRS